MKLFRLLFTLCFLWLLALYLGPRSEVETLSLFSLLYGAYLFIDFIESFGRKLPYFEMMFALFGIQLLVAPYLEYYYFKNEVFGVMLVNEETYFSFVTWSIVAIHIGFTLIRKDETESYAKISIKEKAVQYERIGVYLIAIGYLFFLLTFLSKNFVFTTLAFFRFIGSLYVWFSDSKQKVVYMAVVWVPFVLLILKSAVFINLIIWSGLIFMLLVLNKRVNRLVLYSLIVVSFFTVTILQTVKHAYREIAWSDKNQEAPSLVSMMIDHAQNTDSETFKVMGSGLNIRVNQGWIISHGMDHLPAEKHDFESSYLQKEIIGILLPRFIYPNKVAVGSHEKFDKFVGWHLSEGVAMNLGIIGDWYFNFGKQRGILMAFFLGILLGLMHKFYLSKIAVYPDLILWSTLFYFTIMRAGNEFYMIFNWYVKTGLITVLFFKFVRPYLLQKAPLEIKT